MTGIAPFPDTLSAWLWTLGALQSGRAPPGPCRPQDVIMCLDALFRQRRIELLHVRVLRHYGRKGRAPNPAWPRERCDWRLWQDAMGALDYKLRQRGIVGVATAVAAE